MYGGVSGSLLFNSVASSTKIARLCSVALILIAVIKMVHPVFVSNNGVYYFFVCLFFLHLSSVFCVMNINWGICSGGS